MQNYLKLGSWNVICDVCGRKFKNTDVRKRWDGLVVCDGDYETRHVADFIRTNPERNNVKDARPEQADTFVDVPYISTDTTIYCTTLGSTGVVGLAVVGCARVGKGLPI